MFQQQPTFITNFSAHHLPLYQKAIELSGLEGYFEIKNIAYDMGGEIVPNTYAFHSKKPNRPKRGLTKFWCVFDRLRGKIA